MTNQGKPWRDEETLRREYVGKKRTSTDLADEWGCSSTTVRNWLNRFGIEIRGPSHYSRVEYATFTHHDQGYERWHVHSGEDRNATLFVHRLLAVAKYGFDALEEKVVHHKKPIPWLNTYGNIELMSGAEHAKHHSESD